MANNTFKSILLKSVVTLFILVVIIGALVGLFANNIRTMIQAGAQAGPPPISVATAAVESMQWPVETNAIGTVTPLKGVTLSTELPGTITQLSFTSGSLIREGETLIQLDDRSERAELDAAKANAELAKLSLERSRQLLERNTISQAEFDAADAAYKQAVAQVRNIESVIEKKRLVAPFDGLLGIRRVNLGQYVNAGEEVVSLVSVDPINVTFFLPQRDLAYLRKGLVVEVRSDAYPEQVFMGELAALEAQVDEASRMIEVQAKLSNSQGLLRVGMFVDVVITQQAPRDLLAVPATSVLYASFGNSIYVLNESSEEDAPSTATQRFVKLGERRGDYVEVLDGLQLGDRVVTDGAFKLYPGAQLLLEDARAPKPELDPQPADA